MTIAISIYTKFTILLNSNYFRSLAIWIYSQHRIPAVYGWPELCARFYYNGISTGTYFGRAGSDIVAGLKSDGVFGEIDLIIIIVSKREEDVHIVPGGCICKFGIGYNITTGPAALAAAKVVAAGTSAIGHNILNFH